MNKASKLNHERETNNTSVKASSEILRELDDFIFNNRDLLKPEKSTHLSGGLFNTLLNNRWRIILFSLICLYIITLSIFIRFGFFEEQASIWVILILTWFFCSLGYIGYELIKLWKSIYIAFIEIRTRAIPRAAKYTLNSYYQIIEYLAETFDRDNLSDEEIRFRAVISDRKRRVSGIKKSTPLLSILIVAGWIWIVGFPDKIQEINLLNGAIAGTSGIVLLVKFLLDIYLELLDKDVEIYEKCVLILQKAQDFAREEEFYALRAYDKAMEIDDEVIPFESAILTTDKNGE